MFFDILAVFVVSLISSLFICTTSVHGLPLSSAIQNSPSTDLSSSLRLLNHRPVPSVDHDSGDDISEMLIGESSEDDSLSLSSIDVSNQPSLSSQLLYRKLLHQQKRSSMSSKFNINSAFAERADSSNTNNVVNLSQLKEPIRLSPSLKKIGRNKSVCAHLAYDAFTKTYARTTCTIYIQVWSTPQIIIKKS